MSDTGVIGRCKTFDRITGLQDLHDRFGFQTPDDLLEAIKIPRVLKVEIKRGSRTQPSRGGHESFRAKAARSIGDFQGWIKNKSAQIRGQNVSFGTGDYTSLFPILPTVLNDSKKAERKANDQN